MAAGNSLLRIFLAVCVVLQVVAVPRNVYRDRTGLCKRYGMACPVDKTCMIQHIDWPRPMKLPVCVSEKFAPAHMKACYQAPDSGPCAAEFIRWHYNAQANQCSWFYYGGCFGNRNNFFSKGACEKACLGDTKQSMEDTTSDEVKEFPETPEERRAREFLSRPKVEFQELRRPAETVVKRRRKKQSKTTRKNKSRKNWSAETDGQWPRAYRKTMRRGELFKLFSTLNYRHKKA